MTDPAPTPEPDMLGLADLRKAVLAAEQATAEDLTTKAFDNVRLVHTLHDLRTATVPEDWAGVVNQVYLRASTVPPGQVCAVVEQLLLEVQGGWRPGPVRHDTVAGAGYARWGSGGDPVEAPDPDLDSLSLAQLAELDGPAATVAEVLDEWSRRAHGVRSPSHNVGLFLELLAAAGWRVTAIDPGAPVEQLLPRGAD